ncbi:hypothetical protein [Sporosarcina sp. Marseille-Q4943]|uniref:hypothetical protein n=1 Tax=Sporosarcina sp. Marseille-Q4943 TaxID=2942204 RepID=UPI00208DA82F|nr:hypothetical protein [Sporosarcina sp. Marseille-Q4943]
MSCKHFLHDHRTVNALRWAKTSAGLSEIFTTHGTYSSTLTPMEFLEKLPGSKVILQTEPSDHIECVWIFNGSFKTYKVDEYLTNVVFDDDTSISVPVPQKFIDRQTDRLLHTFTYHEGQLNYIFPCIKEFNEQYNAVEHEA